MRTAQPAGERGQERAANPKVKIKMRKKLTINSAIIMIKLLVLNIHYDRNSCMLVFYST
jgi:hypothetical protein